MALAVNQALAHMSHALGGGEISTELDKIGILNQAGEFLHSMHPWRWAQGRSTLLDFRGVLSGTSASWTAATKTLTEASAFTNYSFVGGDEIQITGGTGATTGFYTIASRVSANAITLATSLSSTDLGAVVDWTIKPLTVDLPDDLRELVAITVTNSIVRGVSLVTHEELLQHRSANVDATSDWHFYAAVGYSGEPPAPVLEIWPAATSTVTGGLRAFYRARWTRLTSDSAQINIPEFIEGLFLQIARAYAQGYEREATGSLDARLTEISFGPQFRAAKLSDAAIQPFYATSRNGGGQKAARARYRSGNVCLLVNPVDAPS